MIKYDLLTEEECFGDKKLDLFKKRGLQAYPTDFEQFSNPHCKFINTLNWRESYGKRSYATKTPGKFSNTDSNNIRTVSKDGKKDYQVIDIPIPTRIVVVPDDINELLVGGTAKKSKDGILEIEYGLYPQMVESVEMQKKLDETFILKGTLIPFVIPSDYGDDKEYEIKKYKDKYYVKLKSYDNIKLSNGKTYEEGEEVWFSLEPIRLLYDEKTQKFVSEKVLFDIFYPKNFILYDGTKIDNEFDYEDSNVKDYLDNCFGPLMERLNTLRVNEINKSEGDMVMSSSEEKENKNYEEARNLDYNNVTEEEIIKGCIMSDIPVFLHGLTGDGKSSRIKQLDPETRPIYLSAANEQSLTGRSVYNSSTGETIDKEPTWYTKLCKRCESEPDKIHILFFDELTNAAPTIQGMAFNIVLDKEINGLWKLPNNVRVAAAGNDMEESASAFEFSEPLFSRFAHVYINTTTEDWLKWAVDDTVSYEKLDYKEVNKNRMIHPLISAYISYRSSSGTNVLRTPYNGKTPNADPRKWEMASIMLYETGKPHMLRSLLGEELTYDFVEFIKQNVITIEDVINHNYNEDEVALLDVSQKYALAVALSNVDVDNFETVSEFIRKLDSKEIESVFYNLWSRGDEDRLEMVQEIKVQKMLERKL